MTAQAIDDVLADTFPASDPPAWTPGIVRPAPEVAAQRVERGTPQHETSDLAAHQVEVHAERSRAQLLLSLVGLAGVALLVPIAILAAGTPVALAIRGLIALTEWLLATVGG